MGDLFSKCNKKKDKKYFRRWIIEPKNNSTQTTLKEESCKDSSNKK